VISKLARTSVPAVCASSSRITRVRTSVFAMNPSRVRRTISRISPTTSEVSGAT
jgi:hypothetical protein